MLFSAYAEVFLDDLDSVRWKDAFLCLRRGVSEGDRNCRVPRRFSLPTQRCFRLGPFLRVLKATFLCLRRGVSAQEGLSGGSPSFSLPTQRCFSVISSPDSSYVLFSAYAEVFL